MDDRDEPSENTQGVSDSDGSEEAANGELKPPSRAWQILFVLLAPGALSILILFVVPGRFGLNGLAGLLFGCPLAGIVAACMFAGNMINASSGERLTARIGMSLVFTAASFGLACGGCMVVFPGGI